MKRLMLLLFYFLFKIVQFFGVEKLSKKNDLLIRQSGLAVCYVYKVTGGAAKFRNKAGEKGLRIIDVQKNV